MKVIALGVLAGCVLLQQLPALPPAQFAWLLLAYAPLLLFSRSLRLPLAIACGFLWALYQAPHTCPTLSIAVLKHLS